jgi:hypothetical protein
MQRMTRMRAAPLCNQVLQGTSPLDFFLLRPEPSYVLTAQTTQLKPSPYKISQGNTPHTFQIMSGTVYQLPLEKHSELWIHKSCQRARITNHGQRPTLALKSSLLLSALLLTQLHSFHVCYMNCNPQQKLNEQLQIAIQPYDMPELGKGILSCLCWHHLSSCTKTDTVNDQILCFTW